jgi:hypothetical protein
MGALERDLCYSTNGKGVAQAIGNSPEIECNGDVRLRRFQAGADALRDRLALKLYPQHWPEVAFDILFDSDQRATAIRCIRNTSLRPALPGAKAKHSREK